MRDMKADRHADSQPARKAGRQAGKRKSNVEIGKSGKAKTKN